MEHRLKYGPEEALVEALRAGKTDAFEQLVSVYSKNLLRQAFNRLRDRADAEDLVQELLADLWEKRGKLQIQTTLEGYLHTAMRNRILNDIARNKIKDKAAEYLLHRMDMMQTSILDILAERDLQNTLSSVVSSLPGNMQKIFVLRGEDYSLKEIAQSLGLAEQTVKSYNAELTRRVRIAVAEGYPDINHSLLVAIIYMLTKS